MKFYGNQRYKDITKQAIFYNLRYCNIMMSNILKILKRMKKYMLTSETKYKDNFVNIELIDNVMSCKTVSL